VKKAVGLALQQEPVVRGSMPRNLPVFQEPT
jgi:hypothetical protein